jgi:glycosyltransferase involved in cell wall biosynthesis
MTNELIISVVVCTYNRSEVLALCLDSLANQTIDKTLYEVIIINNNSTDSTENIIKKFIDEKSNFRAFIELEQGLSFARNRGYKEAGGKYIAYIDDDAIAYKNWLEEMYKFIQTHTEVQIFGGPYYGYSSKPLPWWLPKNYGTKNSIKETRELIPKKEWISGSNMVFHISILKQFNGFETSIGMTGNKLSYGEETKLQVKLYANNVPIWYVYDMKVKHLTSDQKLKFSHIFKSGYNVGFVNEIVFEENNNLFYYLFLFCFHIVKYGIRLFNFKNLGEIFYRLFYTLSCDVGMIAHKLKYRKKMSI